MATNLKASPRVRVDGTLWSFNHSGPHLSVDVEMSEFDTPRSDGARFIIDLRQEFCGNDTQSQNDIMADTSEELARTEYYRTHAHATARMEELLRAARAAYPRMLFAEERW